MSQTQKVIHQTVHWITAPQAPASCPLCPSLDCEIPGTRHQILQASETCTTPDDKKCTGHANPAFAEQAKDEIDWRISH